MKAKPLGAGFGHKSRNSASVSDGVRFPLRQSPNGGVIEWITNPRNVLFTDPALGAGVRVHAPLSVTTGSPYALTVDLGESMGVRDNLLIAQPNIADVRGLESELSGGRDQLDSTTAAVISAQAEIDALDIRVTTLETTTTIENRTDDPVGPAIGRIWLRTDL